MIFLFLGTFSKLWNDKQKKKIKKDFLTLGLAEFLYLNFLDSNTIHMPCMYWPC